jgi:hypothetical protein
LTDPTTPTILASRLKRSKPEDVLGKYDAMIANVPEGSRLTLGREDVQTLVDAIRDSRREAQAVWRCSISDFVGSLDILRNRWIASRRKAEREAGAELAAVLDVVYAGRNPAPANHSSAEKAGRTLIERVRETLMTRALVSAMTPDETDAKPR